MKIKAIILAGGAVLALLGAAQFVGLPRARVTVHVIGEDGQPIPDAKVTFSFHVPLPNNPTGVIIGSTDTNGNFTAESEMSIGGLGNGITKDGYYFGGASIPTFTRHIGDHWQPWDQTYTTVLRKIKNPIPMYVCSMGSDIPQVGVPCGYDLEEGDWVAPYGKGKTADFIVTLTNRIYNAFQDFDVSAIITFPNDGDGIQEVQLPEEFANSQFKWPREAPETGYQTQLVIRNALFPSSQNKQPITTWKEHQTYFFRVRTAKQGNQIVSALYGKINSGISLEPRGAKLCDFGFIYYLNPTSLDRNMEWDPQKNLAPIPDDFSQQVRDP